MLLILAEWLSDLASGFNVFSYVTFRTILAALTALALSLLLGPWMIGRLSAYQIGQPIRDDGPQTHLVKAGTPTMGGALILVAVLLATLLCGDLSNRYVWVVLAVTAAFGLVGWLDDYRKLVLTGLGGISGALEVPAPIGRRRGRRPYLPLRHGRRPRRPEGTQLIVPFFKSVVMLPMGFGITSSSTYFYDRRLLQRGEPDGRAGRPGHHARRSSSPAAFGIMAYVAPSTR